jgi:digeranylgeranylglycerophospholipid reductase
MRDNYHDVIVIGAGPVGSYTAYLLAKEGIDVGIFEKNPFIGKDINCTGIVSIECLKRIDVPHEVIQRQINSIKAFSPSGDCFQYRSATPLAYVINRDLFDREINRMSIREGATTYLNMKVNDVAIKDSVFKIKVRTEEGETEFRSKVGIIATGFELNSIYGSFNKSIDYSYGIQTDVTMGNVSDVEVYLGREIAPGSFGWVVPTNSDSAKIGLISKKNPSAYLKRFLQYPLIKNRIKNYDKKIKCSPIPLTRIPKSFAERVIVVGEAAGQVKTTTGGGIYFGLICSEIAAETVLRAFKCNDFSEKFFTEYEISWRKRIEPELKAGKILRNIFSRLSDYQINLVIDLARKDGVLPIIKKSNFDWHKDIITYLVRQLINKNLFR